MLMSIVFSPNNVITINTARKLSVGDTFKDWDTVVVTKDIVNRNHDLVGVVVCCLWQIQASTEMLGKGQSREELEPRFDGKCVQGVTKRNEKSKGPVFH